MSEILPLVELFGDLRDDPNKIRKIVMLLAKRAEQSRENPADFFSFVMREETTRKQIRLMPHQKILFDFAMMHEKCVIMIPVGHSKTFCMAAFCMWLMGRNPTTRGAIVSATQIQAAKVLGAVRDYIDQSAELKMVFPKLRKSPRTGDPWNQSALTIERPMGIRDPSLVALGLDGAIAGSRLSWVLVDDILNRENTSTPEHRAKVYEWFDSSVLSRLDPKGSKIVVTNTAWHAQDLVHDLMGRAEWPTLKMSTTGEVRVFNSDYGYPGYPGSDDLRDSHPVRKGAMINPEEYHCRLTQHDPDPNNETPIWPERFSVEVIEEKRRTHLPMQFRQAFLNEVGGSEDQMCRPEYINRCKMAGAGMTLLREPYLGNNQTFTGVDLAVSKGEHADKTAFFTFEVLQDGRRKILDVELGRFNGVTIVEKIREKHRLYNSVIRVENNGAQDFIRQAVIAADASIPIRAHTTGRAKADPRFGVQSLFIELMNGAWIIPCDNYLRCDKHVQEWITECLNYQPSNHTGDALMASYFAREQAREFGLGWNNLPLNSSNGSPGDVMFR
jgi:hypothetical protein